MSGHQTTRARGQNLREIGDLLGDTHSAPASPFTHKPQSPCVSKLEVGYLYPQWRRAFLTRHWAIATLYSAENPVPALSISGPEAKNPATANRKNMTVGDREYSSSLGRKGWLWGNCRLFVQARQCCVCLLLRSLASWLPLHCHRTGIMDSVAAVGGISATSSCASPSLISLCLSRLSSPQLRCAAVNVVTHAHSCELPCVTLGLCCWPESRYAGAAQGVGCLSHLDRSCCLRDWREDAIRVFPCQDFTALKLVIFLLPGYFYTHNM